MIACNSTKISYKLINIYLLTYIIMEKTENKHVHNVKKMFDENNLDVAERKLDNGMEKLAHIWRIENLINHKLMKDILASKFVHDINVKIAPYLKTIFLVIGWISVISGIIGIFSFLLGLSGLGFVFSFGFGIGLRVIIYILVALAFSLLSLVCGIGMIKMKKRLPALIFIAFLVTVLGIIISFIPSGFMVTSYGSFGSALFNLILSFILVVIVFKNKELFHK